MKGHWSQNCQFWFMLPDTWHLIKFINFHIFWIFCNNATIRTRHKIQGVPYAVFLSFCILPTPDAGGAQKEHEEGLQCNWGPPALGELLWTGQPTGEYTDHKLLPGFLPWPLLKRPAIVTDMDLRRVSLKRQEQKCLKWSATAANKIIFLMAKFHFLGTRGPLNITSSTNYAI